MEQAETINITNPGTVAEKIDIKAEQVAGRDMYNVNVNESKLKFSKFDISPYSEEKYPSPIFTDDLFCRLINTRILILSGGQGFDKGSFTRHLASQLLVNHSNFSAKEIQSNSENRSLYRDLLQGDEKTIYVLDQLHPQHLDYDLERISNVSHQKNLYLLITTDLAINAWDLNESQSRKYAFVIPTHNLYSKDTLTRFLREGLKRKKDVLKKIIPTRIDDSLNGTLLGESLDDLAVDFGTPENISFFISLLSGEGEEISAARLKEIANEVNISNQSLVTKWFRSLDNRQKLVALGVSLLEGMYDDQFFSVMEEVVDGFWKHSDSKLQALDYIDLEFLMDYFKLEKLDDERQVLKDRFPNQRTDIIKAAWTTHRRHILAVLPVLVKNVNESVNNKSSDWEKFGTLIRQMNIRHAISTTIADIGLVSAISVENALIELAAQHNQTLQRVAAKALARWREFGKDEQLFSTLDDWLNDQRIKNLITEYLSKRNGEGEIKITSKASSYLKATAVLALSYSANYDSPNHLSKEIIRLIKEILNDEDSLVRSRLFEALPRLIHHHVLQLKEVIIEDFIRFDDLQEPIATALCGAYSDYPHDIKSTIFQWLKDCVDNPSDLNQRKKLTYRDKVLVTVFEVFSRIEFTNTDKDTINLTEVCTWLSKFDGQEKRLAIRERLYLTLGRVIATDWNIAEKILPKFIADPINTKEAEILVSVFTSIYLEQRRQLNGTPYGFHWNEEYYPVWLSVQDRPSTDIEKVMLKWVGLDDLALKQIATLAFLSFAKKFELDEIEATYSIKEEELRNSRKVHLNATSSWSAPVVNSSVSHYQYEPVISLWIRIRIFFLLLFEPKNNRVTLKSILKLIYRYPKFKGRHFTLVFSKWTRSSDEITRKLARWLSRLLG